jgi:hypothetical protein
MEHWREVLSNVDWVDELLGDLGIPEVYYRCARTRILKHEHDTRLAAREQERKDILSAYRGATGIENDIFTRALEMTI